MRIAKAKDVLTKLVPQGEPILFTGPPGIGKTSLVKQVSETLGYDLLIMHPVLDDRVDYKGLPAIVDKGAEFLPFGNLHKLIEAETPTLVFFDDLGQSPGDVQAAIMQLILGRELNGKKISEHIVFVAATNRKEDKAGVAGLLAPLLDRFIAVLPIDFNIDDWAAWMMQQRYDPALVAFSRFKSHYLTSAKPSGEMQKIPTPRSLAGVGKLLANGLGDFEILAGAAGEAWAGEFVAFKKVSDRIPDIKEVWKNPTTLKIPKEPDVLYSLMASIAYHAEEKHIEAMMKFLNRCTPEYAVVALKDCAGRLDALETHPDFHHWIQENYDVFSF